LQAVLDALLPVIPSKNESLLTEKEVTELIIRLDHEAFAVREEATGRILLEGRAYIDLIRAASEIGSTERRSRIRAILAAWSPPSSDQLAPYAAGFEKYLEGIKDAEACRLLAVRAVAVLEKGFPDDGQRKLLERVLGCVAARNHSAALDEVRPLIDHPDERAAVFVTSMIGSHRNIRSFPRVLFDALESERDEIVREAIRWSPNCWDISARDELRLHLLRIFRKQSEPIKFEVSFALMHDFHDDEAFQYLLEQTGNPDPKRARTAIYCVGDACNFNKPVTREILDRLAPHLNSADQELRRAAAEALGTYSGADVVRRLIPLLADQEAIIARAAARGIEDQRDKKMAIQLLHTATESDANAAVRAEASDLLWKLETKLQRTQK
jgi:hypothetical protein